MTSDYPNDSDGDALRRVVAGGSNMSRSMDIDFHIAAWEEVAAQSVAEEAARLGYRTRISFYEQDSDTGPHPPWTCTCTRTMVPDYDALITVQAELANIAHLFGAYVDGWGTFGNADSLAESPTDPHRQMGTSKMIYSGSQYPPMTGLGGRHARFHTYRDWVVNLPAVLFNTAFAILAIVTLCGIVFITRPRAVMHDIRPEMWLPLLLLTGPAQIYAQYLSWTTIFAGNAPTGPAIAVRQVRIPGLLRPAIAALWLCNFVVGFGIVVSLSKPHAGNPQPPPLAAIVIVTMIGFWLAFAANVYLLLAVRTLTLNERVLHRVWKFRLWFDLAMVVTGAIYYRL